MKVSVDNPIKLYPDGDQWCALLGDDLQSGTAEFGDTAEEAIAKLSKKLELPDKSKLSQWITKPL